MRKRRARPSQRRGVHASVAPRDDAGVWTTTGEGKPAPPAKRKPLRVSFVIEAELLERARNAVFALSGPPEVLTLARLFNDGVRHEVERLERKHKKSRPFPPRSGALRPGRRVA